jgi:predicted anti-sigma-YlaC factor YlaD
MRMLGVLSDYLDRGAKARLCRRIEEHLRECPDCRMYVDTLRKTVVLYRGLGEEKVPAGVSQRLFRTIRLAEVRKPQGDKEPRAKKSIRKGKNKNRSVKNRG